VETLYPHQACEFAEVFPLHTGILVKEKSVKKDAPCATNEIRSFSGDGFYAFQVRSYPIHFGHIADICRNADGRPPENN
jgi:hypothetical protein